MTIITPLEQAELVGRLALAAGLAGVLGLERQMGQQPAGLRTHMLVSIGAAAFTMAGTYGVSGLGTVQDAGRIAAQIVTGIGFIGAGTIWRSAGNDRIIRGLTTAASIWVAASIGMLCGYGLYVLAAGCAVVSFVVLRLLRGLERVPTLVWHGILARRRRVARLEAAAPAETTAHARDVHGANGLTNGDAPEAERPEGELPEGSSTAEERALEPATARRVGGKAGRKQSGKKSLKRRRPQTEDMISE